MKKQLLACLFLAAAVVPQLNAEVTYTCTAGLKFGENEGIDKMFDNNTDTKYCGGAGDDCWALVTASEPVYVRAYETTTANDNEQSGGRCARHWAVYGTNDETVAADANSEDWVTLSDLDNEPWPADLMPSKNFYTQRFYCDKGTVGTAYKYFKVHIKKGDTPFQLSEFKILGETTPIVTYDWQENLSAPGSDKAVDWGLKGNQKWEGQTALVGKSLVIKTNDDKAHAVIKYSLTTHDDNKSPNRAPKSWIIEGSDDLTEWVTIDEVTDGGIPDERVKTVDFTPSNTTLACKYIKLTLTSMKGNGYQQLGEFHVVASPEIHEHSWELTDGKDATCVEAGGGVYTCSVCGAKKLVENQPATGEHKYIETEGHDHKNCSMCGRPDPEYMSAVDGFYQPTTADHFAWLAEMMQLGETVNIRLTQNVDLTGFTGFGNGNEAVPFKGEFDGAGFWLQNLTIDVEENNVGLFGKVEDANIHDLGLENAYVKSNRPNVGVLAGNVNNTTINRVAVMTSEAHGYDHVGALVGNTEGNTTISNCMSDITVHSTTYQAGGLVGTTNGLLLEKCLFTGQVLNDRDNASGLVALIDSEKSPTIIRNNISAASLLKANNDGQRPIINTGGRQATYENNRVAASQLYQKGSDEPLTKEWTDADDENGLTTADRDMKCLSFYTDQMSWNMNQDWKFIEAGMYPVLAWMEGEADSQTVSVPDTRHVTVVAQADINIPEGVEVYAVQVADDNTPQVLADDTQTIDEAIKLVLLSGTIPANTPILVKADEGEYTFNHHVEYGDEVGENHLSVATEPVTADGTHFTLETVSKKVGFSKVNEGDVIPTGNVYLSIPNPTKDFYTIHDTTLTGVESVAIPSEDGPETIYNLAGQRINRMQKGINIINGKKILN